MSTERRIYRPATAETVQRRKEWVSLDGGDLCVWEMTVAETMLLAERSTRPKVDPRGGIDQQEAIIAQILLSCYDDEEPGARRIFSDDAEGMKAVFALRFEEFSRLMEVINRVNGKDATEEELLRDFTRATGAPNPSDSPTSASRNSDGSPMKLMSPTTS